MTISRSAALRRRVAAPAGTLAVLAVVLALTGCVTDEAGRRPAAVQATAGDAAALPAPRTAAAPTAPVAWRPPPASQPRTTTELIGLDDIALIRLLGEPSLRRREPPAEVWQYAGRSCTLHVFLYRGADADYRVLHAEASGADKGADCPARLVEERRLRPRSS